MTLFLLWYTKGNLENVLDDLMRAGGEGVFVVIDVRDTDVEEEIYQKGTHVLHQKNLQINDVFKDCIFESEIHFANHSYHRPSQLWAEVSEIQGR